MQREDDGGHWGAGTGEWGGGSDDEHVGLDEDGEHEFSGLLGLECDSGKKEQASKRRKLTVGDLLCLSQ